MIKQLRTSIIASLAVCCIGCTSLKTKWDKELLDYATVEAGATVKTSGYNGVRHSNSLINGIKDASKWSEGEGWEYTWRREHDQRRQENEERGGVIANVIRKGSPWILITFDEPKRINQIVIREAHTLEEPAIGIENAFLQYYDTDDKLRPWKTIAVVQSGWALIPGRQQFKMKPVSKFLFTPVKTKQVRIVINTMMQKDIERKVINNRVTRSIEMTVRLLEIEVKGAEAK